MKASFFSLVLLPLICTSAQIDKYLLQAPQVNCNAGPFFVGIAFDEKSQIQFSLNDDERIQFNKILAKNIEQATGRTYKTIKPDELDAYKLCTEQNFVLARLDEYTEEYDGGGERRGHIAVTLLFFASPADSLPSKTVYGEATGRSDYGHSDPLEYALERVGKELREKLRQ